MILAAYNSGLYKTFLVLHLLTVVIGFGGITIVGFVGAASQGYKGPAGQAIFDTSQRLGRIVEFFIYAVPVFGIILLFASKTAGDYVVWFDQTWVSISLLIYIATIGFVHALHLPNLRRMGVLMAELNAGPPAAGGPPPQAAELEERGKRAGLYGAISNMAWVAVLILMVAKPGL
jgi:hypothetical protein